MTVNHLQSQSGDYRGYDFRASTEINEELVRVGPGTPCGEYLRRFWHPFFLSSDLGERPVVVRLLGEELVLFRDKSRRLGLVHKRCPHRQASLEFGRCEDKGIRCCYHGWQFDIDGALLDAPGQSLTLNRRLKDRVRLGAYPTVEHQGLIFAYLGPPTQQPEFPVFDAMTFEKMERVPYAAPFRCNWLQVLDAILDPLHTSFLHSSIGRVQFSDGFGEVGQIDFFDRNAWLLGVNTRRVGDNVWLRVNELVLPNVTQAGSAFAADGTEVRYYGRSSFTRWVVPLDDENTTCFAWANFGERGDPPEWNTPEGPELIEQGEAFDRSYEEKQRSPADVEAVEGMGPITIHANENLVVSDKGIAVMRKRLQDEIKKISNGGQPLRANKNSDGVVPTYGGDTVLAMPRQSLGDEATHLSRLAHAFMAIQFDTADESDLDRQAKVIKELQRLEQSGLGEFVDEQ